MSCGVHIQFLSGYLFLLLYLFGTFFASRHFCNTFIANMFDLCQTIDSLDNCMQECVCTFSSLICIAIAIRVYSSHGIEKYCNYM